MVSTQFFPLESFDFLSSPPQTIISAEELRKRDWAKSLNRSILTGQFPCSQLIHTFLNVISQEQLEKYEKSADQEVKPIVQIAMAGHEYRLTENIKAMVLAKKAFYERKKKEHDAQLASIRSEIASIKKNFAALKEKLSKCKSNNKSNLAEITGMLQQLENLEKKRKGIKKELEECKSELKRIKIKS